MSVFRFSSVVALTKLYVSVLEVMFVVSVDLLDSYEYVSYYESEVSFTSVVEPVVASSVMLVILGRIRFPWECYDYRISKIGYT